MLLNPRHQFYLTWLPLNKKLLSGSKTKGWSVLFPRTYPFGGLNYSYLIIHHSLQFCVPVLVAYPNPSIQVSVAVEVLVHSLPTSWMMFEDHDLRWQMLVEINFVCLTKPKKLQKKMVVDQANNYKKNTCVVALIVLLPGQNGPVFPTRPECESSTSQVEIFSLGAICPEVLRNKKKQHDNMYRETNMSHCLYL